MMNLSSLTLYAGSKWSWTENPANYLAPDFTLKLFLKLKNNPTIEFLSTQNGTGFDFNIEQIQTSIAPGNYSYQFQAFDSQNVMSLVEAGTITILPNLSTADDSRTYWEQIADEAKQAYRTLINQVADSITLSNGKTITFTNRKELIKIIHNAEVKAGIKSAKTRTFAKFINP
ncbi:MAG TPA: hypothetical protein PK665_14575 [Ignavibacteriaceae bacterium]|nr:hypothetical protein [Ignavibacteriaceae bacterium]